MKTRFIIITISIFFLCGCGKTKNFGGSLFAHIDDQIRYYSNDRFFLDIDVYTDRVYIQDEYYIELPRLGYGFYLEYSSDSLYPNLKYMGNFELHLPYFDYLIQELFVLSNSIIIRDTLNQKYIEIQFDNPFEYTIFAGKYPDGFEKKYVFEPLNEEFKAGNITKYTFGIQDNEFLKSHNVDFATPVLGAIISAGIVIRENKAHIIGETLYGFYSMSLETGEVVYYKDERDFYEDMNERFTKENISIAQFEYKKSYFNKIHNKKPRQFYTRVAQGCQAPIFDLQEAMKS
jgi:hypothetical protein